MPIVDWLTDQSLNDSDFRYNGNEEAGIDEFLEEHGDLDINFLADTQHIEEIQYYSLNENVHNILLEEIQLIDNEFMTMYEYDFDVNERFLHIEMYK